MASNTERSNSLSRFQAIVSQIKHVLQLPMTIALVLSCLSTAIKTAAWYGQTIIPDEALLPAKWPPHDPQYRDIAFITIKTLLSWSIALFEYVPLTMANSIANNAQINLTNLRGAIEAMDLGWFVLFLHFAKHAHLNWHQYAGLVLAGIGCAIVNKPDWLFPKFDKKVEKFQTKLVEDLTAFFERLSTLCKRKTKDEEFLDIESTNQNDITINSKLSPTDALYPHFVKPNSLIQKLDSIDLNNEEISDEHKAVDAPDLTNKNLNDQKNGETEALDIGALSNKITQNSFDLKSIKSIRSNKSNVSTISRSTVTSLSTRIFFAVWLLFQIFFYMLAIFMLIKHKLLIAILSLCISATGVKTIAWYLHTVLGDRELLPPSLTPKNPKAKSFAYATVKVIMSWFLALGEYIPLTYANRMADNHGISLAKIRGAIEAFDLLWLISFMMMVKGENLRWQHILGLAVAGLGVAVANIDVEAEL